MKCGNCNFENPDSTTKCEKCGMILIEVTAKLDTIVEGHTKTDPLDFSPGEKFGSRYQIIEEIGKGGMGKVFKARDIELNIVVALKMIKPELSSDPDIISRFKRELLLAREILHENVIRIHDLGEIDHIRYISMNYIYGNSLKEIIQSTGKLTIEKSIDIAKQVCSALRAAHNKSIVHRDLKPQNIMIDKKGNAFVLDFGIARSIASTGETEAGIVLGTPDFMSPEQIRGKKADAASDIYSLGIIMYEMVTGDLPFKADSPTSLLYLHLNEQAVPPSKLNPQLPKKMEKIILKCMEKKKKDRYQSIEQVLEDLELEKTGQIKPIKERKREKAEIKRKTAPVPGRILKYVFRIFLVLLVIYGAVSVVSLVNDSNFKVELDKIKVEDETHHKNVFPIHKDWLPGDWETKDCNSWETYIKLFPPKSGEQGAPISDEQYIKNEYVKKILESSFLKDYHNIVANFSYSGAEDLKNIIVNRENIFRMADFSAAVRCDKSDSYQLIKTKRSLYLPIVSLYADMIIVKVRDNFLDGNVEQGLREISDFMVFAIDLLSSSTCLAEERLAMSCFTTACRELIPLLLSFNLNLKSRDTGLPGEEEISGTAEQDSTAIITRDNTTVEKQKISSAGKQEPTIEPQDNAEPGEGETAQDAAISLNPEQETGDFSASPLLDQVQNLLGITLEKLEPRDVFYKEYLSLARHYEDVLTYLHLKKPGYLIFGKLKFWNHGFSINRFFFNEGIDFYRGLFEGLKYIDNTRNKSTFIIDYFNKKKTDSTIISADIPQTCREINTARMFAKIALILLRINKFGLDSEEFSSLKSSDLFINECTGKPFEILEDEDGFFLLPGSEHKINLSITGYPENHKQILKSLQAIDYKEEE